MYLKHTVKIYIKFWMTSRCTWTSQNHLNKHHSSVNFLLFMFITKIIYNGSNNTYRTKDKVAARISSNNSLNPDTRNSSLLFLVDVNALSYASDNLIMSNSMSKDQSICQKLMSGWATLYLYILFKVTDNATWIVTWLFIFKAES